MKRRWLLPLALLACLFAAAVLWAAGVFGAPASIGASEEEPAAEPTYEMMYERPLSAWTATEVRVAGQPPFVVDSDLAFDETGRLLGVRNALAQPVLLRGDEDFRFTTDAFQMLVLAAQHLPATDTLPDRAGGDAAYGLDAPAITLDMTYADGADVRLHVGADTPSGDGCYVARAGDPAVYIVPADFKRALAGGLTDMHALPASLGYAADQVTELRVESADAPPLTVTIAAERGATLYPCQITSPLAHPASAARVQAALEALVAATPTAFAGRATDDAALAAYGLDAPSLRVTLVVEGAYLAQYLVGDTTVDGEAYVALDRTGDVYRTPVDRLAFREQLSVEQLADRYVALEPLSGVARVVASMGTGDGDIAVGGASRTLDVTWGESRATPESAYIDGKPVPVNEFTALYREIIAQMWDRLYPSESAVAFGDGNGSGTAGSANGVDGESAGSGAVADNANGSDGESAGSGAVADNANVSDGESAGNGAVTDDANRSDGADTGNGAVADVLVIDFLRADGSARRVAYAPYDRFYCAVSFDGAPTFLIRRGKVAALIQRLGLVSP